MRARKGRAALVASLAMTATVLLVSSAPAHAITYPTLPVIALNRTIPGVPFPGQTGKHQVSAHDNEGSAYVPSDNSLWTSTTTAGVPTSLTPRPEI